MKITKKKTQKVEVTVKTLCDLCGQDLGANLDWCEVNEVNIENGDHILKTVMVKSSIRISARPVGAISSSLSCEKRD